MQSGMNPMMMGGAMMGAGAGQMLAPWRNPSDPAMGYLDQAGGQLNQYLSPYINQGNAQYGNLNNQYNQLMNDPGRRMNEIGRGYQQSPGFQFALQQALQGGNHAAAAGGMAGSPQHEQQNMQMATGMANQDYNQYLQNAMGMYNTGLQGSHNIYNTGANAGIHMGEGMANILANQSKLAYEGQHNENEHQGGMWGSLLGGAGMIAGSMFGGPLGGMAGSYLGNQLGGAMS
jgi:hypothetical protein